MMIIKVDRDRCGGIGLCAMTAPAIFEVGEDGQAQVVTQQLIAADRSLIADAVNNCPTRALSIDE